MKNRTNFKTSEHTDPFKLYTVNFYMIVVCKTMGTLILSVLSEDEGVFITRVRPLPRFIYFIQG